MSSILKLGGLGKRSNHRKTVGKVSDSSADMTVYKMENANRSHDDSDSSMKPAKKSNELVRSRSISIEPHSKIYNYGVSHVNHENQDSSSSPITPPSICMSPPQSPRTSDVNDFDYIEQNDIILSSDIIIPIRKPIEAKFEPSISSQLPTLVESKLAASSSPAISNCQRAHKELESISSLSIDVHRKSTEINEISNHIYEKSKEALNTFDETKSSLNELTNTHRSISSHFMYLLMWIFSFLFSLIKGIQKLIFSIIGIENKKPEVVFRTDSLNIK